MEDLKMLPTFETHHIYRLGTLCLVWRRSIGKGLEAMITLSCVEQAHDWAHWKGTGQSESGGSTLFCQASCSSRNTSRCWWICSPCFLLWMETLEWYILKVRWQMSCSISVHLSTFWQMQRANCLKITLKHGAGYLCIPYVNRRAYSWAQIYPGILHCKFPQ